jgi:hypothetical protein
MYFVLFKTIDDKIDKSLESTITPHYSYIEEKYNLFFKNPPNTDTDIFAEYHWKDKDIWNRGTDYIVHWKMDTNEFLNCKQYPKWLFTFYLVHSTKEYFELLEKYNNNINKEDLRIRRMLLIYNKFFKSYDSILETDNLENILHPMLRDFYQDILKTHKQYFRNVYINQLKEQSM